MTPAEIRELAKHIPMRDACDKCGKAAALLDALAELVEACELYPHSVADAIPACVIALAKIEAV